MQEKELEEALKHLIEHNEELSKKYIAPVNMYYEGVVAGLKAALTLHHKEDWSLSDKALLSKE